LREIIISVTLLIILRYHTKGLIPERLSHPALPADPTPGLAVPSRTGAMT
jgi:hypothetical protein